jgi:hypothetical protein
MSRSQGHAAAWSKGGPERLVVGVRYLYRDRIKDQTRGNPADALTSCIGFGERRFVLARKGDSLDVEEGIDPQPVRWESIP